MIAVPPSAIVVRTSAKSRLMRPWTVMRSEMPRVGVVEHVVGHLEGVDERGVVLGDVEEPLVRDDDERVDGLLRRLDALARPTYIRLRPSQSNGLVTMATVRMPIRLAMAATTGAPPVPVPPPMPAVTKTMSEPARAVSISARLSSAASAPTDGRAPAPSPFVSSRPTWILVRGFVGRAPARRC